MPAHTTVTPVAASVVRSADSSQLSRASRCTPPSPPVAKTSMPASAARWDVEATVVAHARLGEAPAERHALQRRVVEADARLAVDDGDRGRHGAFRAHRGLQLARHLEVAPARQPVCDQRTLERHHGPPGGQGGGDLGGDAQERGHGAGPWYWRANGPSIRPAGVEPALSRHYAEQCWARAQFTKSRLGPGTAGGTSWSPDSPSCSRPRSPRRSSTATRATGGRPASSPRCWASRSWGSSCPSRPARSR